MAERSEEPIPPVERRDEYGRVPGDWVEDYLKEYSRLAIKGDACKYANISPSAVIAWRKKHPEFVEREAQIRADVLDKVRKELMQRSLEGTVKGIWHEGQLVGSEVVYDNKLLMWVAERLMREEFHLADKLEVENNTVVRFDFRLGEREDPKDEELEAADADYEELDEGPAALGT